MVFVVNQSLRLAGDNMDALIGARKSPAKSAVREAAFRLQVVSRADATCSGAPIGRRSPAIAWRLAEKSLANVHHDPPPTNDALLRVDLCMDNVDLNAASSHQFKQRRFAPRGAL
jgi:hypothetical protein